MGIVDFTDVTFSYDGRARALDGVTLAIEPGSFVCVLGGNGSGKSTLARHVNALLLPDAGEVRVVGLRTDDAANLFEIRRSAGLVFQNPDDQIVASVVEDDVAFGPENVGVPSGELPALVQAALARVGLRGFGTRETFALSGGQKQRVAIAGVCAMDPRVIVFDEAGSMLDPRGRRGLMRLCRELNEAGMTIVLITHFMEEAACADRVVVLDGGTVAMDGAPADVLSQARRLQELNLEAPFAVRMSMALQDAGVPVGVCVDEGALERELVRLGIEGGQASEAGARDVAAAREEDPPAVAAAQGAAPGGSAVAVAAAMETLREPIMTLENVSFSYAPKRARKKAATEDAWAVRDVSFALNEGDFLGIAGHTGSGKSTLLQLMAAILHPSEGRVLLRGHDVADKRSVRELRRSVGLVFQYPEHQLFAATVLEDVAFGPRNLGLSADEVDVRVHRALELVHLSPEEVGAKSPFELSGGQQRRVALAGVLAMEPHVLILDEPTAGLDPKAHGLFLDLIAELHETSNAATVMVSHSMDDLAAVCNRVMLLSEGRIVADGSPGEIFSDEEGVRRIGLGVPHTVELAARLGLRGCVVGAGGCVRVPTVPELAREIAAVWGRTGGGGAA